MVRCLDSREFGGSGLASADQSAAVFGEFDHSQCGGRFQGFPVPDVVSVLAGEFPAELVFGSKMKSSGRVVSKFHLQWQ